MSHVYTHIHLIDVCLSDYFRGSTNPILCVPVYHSMSKKDFADLIITEYNQMDNCSFPEINNFENIVKDFISTLSDTPFYCLDCSTDRGEGETVYAYIGAI